MDTTALNTLGFSAATAGEKASAAHSISSISLMTLLLRTLRQVGQGDGAAMDYY